MIGLFIRRGLHLISTAMDANFTPPEPNEKVLFILEKSSGVALYSHEYILGGEDPQLLSGFISAMTHFIASMTGSDQNSWKTEYGGDTVLLVEGGDWAVGVLALSRETNEARSKLRRIVREFEGSFEWTDAVRAHDEKLEQEFDSFVMRVMIPDRLTENSILIKTEAYVDHMRPFPHSIDTTQAVIFLMSVQSGDTIGQASKTQGIKYDDAVKFATLSYWHNGIDIIYVPSSDDILSCSDGTLSVLLQKSNPLGVSPLTMKVISHLNGRSPLSTYLHEMKPRDLKTTLIELGRLSNSGYIHRISIEKRIVLVNECILNDILSLGVYILREEKMGAFVKSIFTKGIPLHPWITRIKVLPDLKILCNLDEGMTTNDLDDMYEALEYLINEVLDFMNEKSDFDYISSATSKAKRRCGELWGQFIQDTMV
jgi:hypothetical protein